MTGRRIRWDPIEVPGQAPGPFELESARYTSPEVEPDTGASIKLALDAWFDGVPESLHWIRSKPRPTVTRIDAAPSVMERVREALPIVLAPRAMTLGYATIELVSDDDLPRGAIRRHWSDGRAEVVRLDAAETEEG